MTTQAHKNMTQKAFCEASHLSPKLIRAVVRQMGGWESFTGSAEDITNHGIDGGFSGFIYNRHTEAFARRNRAEISKMATQQADDMGVGTIDMIRGFGCFRGGELPTDEEIGTALYAGRNIEDGHNVLNALAWYAGEEVARSYTDIKNT